jgi:hypothetical protein
MADTEVSVRLPAAIVDRLVRALEDAGETQITPSVVEEEFQARMDRLGAFIAAEDESERSSLCPECYGRGYCELRELHLCVPDR